MPQKENTPPKIFKSFYFFILRLFYTPRNILKYLNDVFLSLRFPWFRKLDQQTRTPWIKWAVFLGFLASFLMIIFVGRGFLFQTKEIMPIFILLGGESLKILTGYWLYFVFVVLGFILLEIFLYQIKRPLKTYLHKREMKTLTLEVAQALSVLEELKARRRILDQEIKNFSKRQKILGGEIKNNKAKIFAIITTFREIMEKY